MLNGSARKYLRGLAHGLRPAVQVGKEGLTEAVVAAIDAAIEASELVKVQITAEREERRAAAARIEERLSCECVGTVGRMAILFRQHPDPEKRSVRIPG
jgi:RNA-binding protein